MSTEQDFFFHSSGLRYHNRRKRQRRGDQERRDLGFRNIVHAVIKSHYPQWVPRPNRRTIKGRRCKTLTGSLKGMRPQ